MANLKALKLVLRKSIKKKIALLSEAEKRRQSEIVTAKLLAHPFYQKSSRVSVYISMNDELQTEDIIRDIFQSKKSCFIPRYDENSRHMDMVRVKSLADLESLPFTKWNVRQPMSSDRRQDALDTGGLDLIIVPGLAFTRQGARLGRGGGYYDTFLDRCRRLQVPPPTTAALAFRDQILASVPTSETDINVDVVLFPDD